MNILQDGIVQLGKQGIQTLTLSEYLREKWRNHFEDVNHLDIETT
jgi:hypothetical protein